MHKRKGAENHYRRRGKAECGKPVALITERRAEIEHRRHHECAHRRRHEIAQRYVKQRYREHDDEHDFRIYAQFAEKPIHGACQRGDVQTADGKDVRKTARLHVAVKQVVYASLVAYHESAGDDGRVLVHMFVKQAADFELNAEYEIRLSRGEEFRAVRPYRK